MRKRVTMKCTFLEISCCAVSDSHSTGPSSNVSFRKSIKSIISPSYLYRIDKSNFHALFSLFTLYLRKISAFTSFNMALSNKPPANGFVATMRSLYNPIGFGKGYNFVLFFIFAGAMMGFSLSRFMFLNFDGIFCSFANPSNAQSSPGECWTYEQHPQYIIGIKMHLFTVIPASFLVCFQFVPIIRHKFILVHRMNGYLVILLAVFGMVGALMIARVSFGGGIAIQSGTGMLAIVFLTSLGIAVYNVKMLQLEQHRAWMLRAWFYVSLLMHIKLR